MKSIMQGESDRCYMCGRPGTEWHHVFGAANRRFFEEDGLKVRLCRYCNDMTHFDPDESYRRQEFLHEEGQRAYEQSHTREEFMQRYGRNYL